MGSGCGLLFCLTGLECPCRDGACDAGVAEGGGLDSALGSERSTKSQLDQKGYSGAGASCEVKAGNTGIWALDVGGVGASCELKVGYTGNDAGFDGGVGLDCV